MASRAWDRSPAWGTVSVAVHTPAFEDIMKEQENEKSSDNSRKASNKRSAADWLASEPWYHGKVNRNKRKPQEGLSGCESPSQWKPANRTWTFTPSSSYSNKNTQSSITVVNVHKKDLNNFGYKDLLEWIQAPDHLYIGRNMTHYVPGAVGSKWQNPFKSKQLGREQCVKLYKDYILTDKTIQQNGKTLFESLGELKGKTLGCWCHPERCHGHILQDLVEEYCP